MRIHLSLSMDEVESVMQRVTIIIMLNEEHMLPWGALHTPIRVEIHVKYM